jgi:2-keto-4-pentenoate hydratase/2-oxohepta-3-ene-1,7-dioic acid hydratase in catechol pathway
MLVARGLIAGEIRQGEVKDGRFHPLRGDLFDDPQRDGAPLALDAVELLAPVAPGKVLVVLGGFLTPERPEVEPEERPRVFPKVVSEVSGDGGVIVEPPFLTGPLRVEGELAVVVGAPLRLATAEEAEAAIFGYTTFNDATAWEFVTQQDVFTAKSVETFASMGPWIQTGITAHDIAAGLVISTRINGELSQTGTTKLYRFPVGEVLAHASRTMTLHPGDVIALGTPPPVPPPAVEPGDEVEIEVDRIGVLHNLIAAHPGP